jgi:hypothetical protein
LRHAACRLYQNRLLSPLHFPGFISKPSNVSSVEVCLRPSAKKPQIFTDLTFTAEMLVEDYFTVIAKDVTC